MQITQCPLYPELRDDKRLKSIFALVEADSYAAHMLWREYAEQDADIGFGLSRKLRVYWQQDLSGLFVVAGHLDDKPVTINMRFATIDSALVCFWDSPSTFVSHDLIRDWFVTNVTNAAGGRPYETDAMNFANAIHEIHRAREAQAA